MADDDRSRAEREVLDALDEAREAIREYDYELHMAAARNTDPETDPDVQEAHIIAHIATLRAFGRLRPYVKEHLNPTYWCGSVIFDRGDRYIQGLKSLELFQGRVYSRSQTVTRKHGGRQTVTDWESQLLPPDACRRTVELLGECCVHLGFMEAPDPPPTVHVLDSQGGDGDWVKENDYEDVVDQQTDQEPQVQVGGAD